MPGLTVDTTQRPQAQSQAVDSPPNSRSTSPTRPPYSPITPTLSSARLASQNDTTPPRQTYTHSQPAQTAIPQPPPVPIAFDENPDALALKSAISILQMQARNATEDIKTLQRIKERALEDPEAFTRALVDGEVTTKKDPLLNPSPSGDDDEDEDDDEGQGEGEDKMVIDKEVKKKTWPALPTPQNVVRCPPINWNQYAVVGESLDKLHQDQVKRPTDGMPQRVGPDGQLMFGGEGQRRNTDVGVAAPYDPTRDRIEKMGTRKGGKR